MLSIGEAQHTLSFWWIPAPQQRSARFYPSMLDPRQTGESLVARLILPTLHSRYPTCSASRKEDTPRECPDRTPPEVAPWAPSAPPASQVVGPPSAAKPWSPPAPMVDEMEPSTHPARRKHPDSQLHTCRISACIPHVCIQQCLAFVSVQISF